MTAFRRIAQPTEDALVELLAGAQSDLHGLLTRLEPWERDFADKAWQGVADIAAALWPRLRQLMPGRSDLSLLQQAWAARFRSRVHIGLLYRAGLSHPDLLNETVRLHALTLRRWRSPTSASGDVRTRGLVSFLMAPDAQKAGVPDLGPHTRYRGSIRLRYRVAHLCEQGAGLAVAINAAARQPAATAYQRRIELSRAVHAGRAAGRQWQALTDLSFALLTPAAQKLLLSVPHLWPWVFTAAVSRRIDLLAHLHSLIAERDRVQALLSQVMQHVRLRRLDQIDPIMDQLPDNALVRALGRRLREEPWGLACNHAHPSLQASFGPWVPMSRVSLHRLQAWAPSTLPPWWAMRPSDLARDLCQGQLAPEAVQQLEKTVQDLAPLRRDWTDAEQQDLIRCGHVRLPSTEASVWDGLSLAEIATAMRALPGLWTSLLAHRLDQLPDARPWLALMAASSSEEDARELRNMAQLAIGIHWRERPHGNWSAWIAPSYGCPGWEAAEALALANTVPIKEACAMFAAGRLPLHPEAFRQVLARSLHQSELLPPRPMLYIKRWLTHDPVGATALADHGPRHWVERLVANVTTPLAALDAFMASELIAPELKRLAWRNRLARTREAGALAELSLRMPPRTGRFPELSQWLLSGPDASQAAALVLTARRDGPRLLALSQRFGADVFLSACGEASAMLRRMASDPTAQAFERRSARDAAALELLTHLGVEAASCLMQALAMCRSAHGAGGQLDGAYAEHHIPKKTGGTRMISAPHPLLRHTQRLILDKLLAPLGAHPAACGFVPGRSIVHNAQPHVGRAVVVNADIRNCFPSVRWPLVLAALRRELGHRLSTTAIGLLLDLCTARGALPVGAPTSPALLNLVLRRTDQVLHDSAQRKGVRYTRYADDITFSGDNSALGLLRLAERTLAQIDLTLDPAKTNVFRPGRRQMVTGLVVNQQVAVPRAVRRRLRAAVHHAQNGAPFHWDGQPQSLAALRGRLAFVAMVNQAHAKPLIEGLRRVSAEVPSLDADHQAPEGPSA